MTEHNLNLITSSVFFSEIDESFFPEHRTLANIIINDCLIKEYKKGEVIIREGDYGTSSFVILNGSVWYLNEKLPEKLLGHKQNRAKKSRVELILNYLKSSSHRPTQKKHSQVLNKISNLDKALNQYQKTLLERGDVFGESSPFGKDPRSATIVANENSTIVEIKWQGVRDLRKYSPEVKELFDSLYRARSLEKTIKNNDIFKTLPDQQLTTILREAVLETRGKIEHDEVDPDSEREIISIGDYVNGLVIIRSGFAKICNKEGQTVKYLSKGDTFGFSEIYQNWKNSEHIPHQFSLTVLGYLETIFIQTSLIEAVLPHVEPKTIPNLANDNKILTQADPGLLNFLVSNRLNNGRSIMMIDLERCTRCNDCVDACSITHENTPRFKIEGKQHGKYLIAKSCMHCSEPYCMNDCPTGAIYRDPVHGEVIVNSETCIGCSNCAESCIYENINMIKIENKTLGFENNQPILKASKCDLCIENNIGPACEKSCPTEALKRIDLSKFDSFIKWSKDY